MKNMDLSFLAEKDFCLQFLGSITNISNVDTKARYSCTLADMRNFCRFFYITGGDFYITPKGGKEIRVRTHELIFLPADIAYKARWEGEHAGYYCLCFRLLDEDGFMDFGKDISFVENDKNAAYLPHLQEIHKAWTEGRFGYKLKCNALCFDFLKILCLNNLKSKVSQNCQSISEGILYLENHYTEDITTKQLAQMCHMSTANFRRLFQHYSEYPPMTYRNMLRIHKAAQLLKTNEFSVQEVADAVNIHDLYYFSKIFKSFMGVSPKKYV